MDPDLSPDESMLVAVRDAPGRRDLVLIATTGLKARTSAERTGGVLAVETGVVQGFSPAVQTLVSEPETQFDAPRWSPDGRTIAVERHRLGAWSELVVVDVETRMVRVVASADRTRIVTPAWRRDGRSIVAAVARDEEVFNLFEFDADGSGSARQLTRTTGGATWPDVSPDGQTIAFVAYTANGFDVFQTPYPAPANSDPTRDLAVVRPPAPGSQPGFEGKPDTTDVRKTNATTIQAMRYSPWRTLSPTWWSPIVEGDQDQQRIGAATTGADVLGYHAYALSATWLVSHTARAPSPPSAAPDWQATYAYTRWRPTLWLSASSTTSFLTGQPTDDGLPSISTLREREYAAGVVFPINHVRVSHTAAASIVRGIDESALAGGDMPRPPHRAPGRVVDQVGSHLWFFRQPGTGRRVRRNRRSRTPGVRVGRRRHGLHRRPAGVRARARSSSRHRAPACRRRFERRSCPGAHVSPGGPSTNADVLDFGRRAISLLRGFSSNTFAGSRVALLNLDYRFPIARPQRGIGTWPGFLHTLHAAAFVDAGHAWTRQFAARDLKTSAGGELSADLVAGYAFRLTATAGAAWGHDGSGTIANRTTIYARVGRAF